MTTNMFEAGSSEVKANMAVAGVRVETKRRDQANKSIGWMPMALIAEEGRGQLRKASGSCKRA